MPGAVGVVILGAGALALSRALGWPSGIALAVAGVAFGAVLLFGERREFGAVAATFTGSMIGGFIGVGCLGDLILTSVYLYDHGQGEGFRSFLTGGTIGVLIGAMIASARYHIRETRRANPDRPREPIDTGCG